MNPENKDLRNIQTNEPAVSSGSIADGSGLARKDGESRDVARKSRGFSKPVIVIACATLCMGLNSCLFPYDESGNHGSGYTSVYRPGFRVDSLPGGYRREMISGNTYYYHDGYYYRPGSGGYVVVDAPRGSRYYDDYNRRQRTYHTNRTYQESSGGPDGRYERTEVITRLPDGYRVVNYRGDTYYQAGDRYYRRQGDSYVITTRPY